MFGSPEVLPPAPAGSQLLMSNEALLVVAFISALLIISLFCCVPDFSARWIPITFTLAILVVTIVKYAFPSIYPDVVNTVLTLLLYVVGMAYVGLSATLLIFGLPAGQVTDAHRKGENRQEEKDENANSQRKDRNPFAELHSVIHTRD